MTALRHRVSQQPRGQLNVCIVTFSFPSAEKFLVVWLLPGLLLCSDPSTPFLDTEELDSDQRKEEHSALSFP